MKLQVSSQLVATCAFQARIIQKRSFFEAVNRDWDKAWKKRVTPWDTNVAAPPLVNLLKNGKLRRPPLHGRALVPGCGSGYECIELARAGWSVLGVDISTTALDRAASLLKSAQAQSEGGPLKGSVEYSASDFYGLTERFPLIFDYTFLCALPPDTRKSWAIKMRDLLEDDGELITLMFPVNNNASTHILDVENGPPFEVNCHLYEELLTPVGFECRSMVGPCSDSIKPRLGREWLGRWRKRK